MTTPPQPRHPLAEKIAAMSADELAELQDQYASMSAGPQDELAAEVDARIAALSADQTF